MCNDKNEAKVRSVPIPEVNSSGKGEIVIASGATSKGLDMGMLGKRRFAIVSTPRSGNTWLRRMLSLIYELQEIAAHTPRDVHWEQLPEHFILQPAYEALQIFHAHAGIFADLGYKVEPDPRLSRAQANANWRRLQAQTRVRDNALLRNVRS